MISGLQTKERPTIVILGRIGRSEGIGSSVRTIAVAFFGLVLWAMARLAAESLGLSKWSVVPVLLIAGLMLQLMYARHVNMHMVE